MDILGTKLLSPWVNLSFELGDPTHARSYVGMYKADGPLFRYGIVPSAE